MPRPYRVPMRVPLSTAIVLLPLSIMALTLGLGVLFVLGWLVWTLA